MLTIKLHTASEGLCLRMAGHAGAGKKGSDIVCAAASILACTAAQTAQQLFRDGRLTKAPFVRLEPGFAQVEIFEHCDAAENAFYTVQTGLSLLAAKYPDHVRLVL